MAIVVTETWLSPDNELVVDGYSLVRRDRDRHGGGVAIFIHNSLPFKPLHLLQPELELVAVECLLDSRIVTIAGLYHPLSSNIEITQLFILFEATKLLQSCSVW